MSEFLFKEEYDELLAQTDFKDIILAPHEIDEAWKEILDINESKLLYADTETPISELSRLYIMEYYYLAMSVGGDISNNVQFILKPLIISIANTSFCIYKNAYDGFKYQSKVLLRNLYEQGLLLLNVLLDKEKRVAILSATNQEIEYNTWRKYFTPKKMHQTIEEFEKNLGDTWSEDWHNRVYKDLSSYAHNDFLSFLLGSFYVGEDEKEEMNINIFGSYADRVDNTLDQLNGLLFFFGMNFLKIISSEHSDVTKEIVCMDNKGDSNNQVFWNRAAFLELLNRKCYLKMFWETHNSEE